ncbi:MAG: hypothetical protein CM1200mP2_51590 [Planctomycetaceae bacterium]|nr:MAG: hypothetical protein CM1200mP2_51590 [Planctomycetaceae bacterium]
MKASIGVMMTSVILTAGTRGRASFRKAQWSRSSSLTKSVGVGIV